MREIVVLFMLMVSSVPGFPSAAPMIDGNVDAVDLHVIGDYVVVVATDRAAQRIRDQVSGSRSWLRILLLVMLLATVVFIGSWLMQSERPTPTQPRHSAPESRPATRTRLSKGKHDAPARAP